jgi:HPt (histidine-containing phosphotransfer) domain-containing protein
MKSTDRENSASAPVASYDEFDRLRETFHARLHGDRIRLTTLAASLARIEGNPAGVFQDLQGLAHRIRGAAAVFQVPELFSAASALEQAATAACIGHADHTDGSVWSALEELVEQLAMTSGSSVGALGGISPVRSVQATCSAPSSAREIPRESSRNSLISAPSNTSEARLPSNRYAPDAPDSSNGKTTIAR